MSAKKKPISTPLHLLHQLSASLLEHLENACSQALIDAEKLLAKLEKQRGKAQEKLHKARSKLQDAAVAGKAKAQAKAKDAVAELEELLDSLKASQSETRTYIAQLKRDAQESLKLAQGVGGQKVSFPGALSAEDDLALLASTRECTRNGSPEKKEGFYQYSAAWDSKHRVTLAEGKTARVLFEMQEMQDGGALL